MDVAVSRRLEAAFTSEDLLTLAQAGRAVAEMRRWDWVCPACRTPLILAFGEQRVYFRTLETAPHVGGCLYDTGSPGGGPSHPFDPRAHADAETIDLSAFSARTSKRALPSPGSGVLHSGGPTSLSEPGPIRISRPQTLAQFASLLVQLDHMGIRFDQRLVVLPSEQTYLLSDVLVTAGLRAEHIARLPHVMDWEDVFVYGVVVDAGIDGQRRGDPALWVRLRPPGAQQTLTDLTVYIPRQFLPQVRPHRGLLVRARPWGDPTDGAVRFATRFPDNVAIGRLQALDGHLVYSADEVMIDDYLAGRGIRHTVPSQHETVWTLERCRAEFNGWIPDWLLHLDHGRTVVVEYFGFAQTGSFGRRYAVRKAEKVAFYKTLAPLYGFIALEQVTARHPALRKQELHLQLDRTLLQTCGLRPRMAAGVGK